MIEVEQRCPECGANVKVAHNEQYAMCAVCGNVLVVAPPTTRRSQPSTSIAALVVESGDVDERGVPRWLRHDEKPFRRRKAAVVVEAEPEESPATIICFMLGLFFFVLYFPLMISAYLIARTRKWKRLAAIALITPIMILAGFLLAWAIIAVSTKGKF